MKNYIIPIFIPHYGCPHMCVFCSQRRITGMETDVTPEAIRKIIESHLQGITREYHIEVAFYGGSFTALPPDLQRSLLAPACDFVKAGRVHALRLSTRPDCIDAAGLRQLGEFGVRTIELGAQSFADAVLACAERGHSGEDIRHAAAMIQAHGFALGIQLMPGLPGDSEAAIMESLAETIRLQPDFVRIYPTVVLDGTKLAERYREGTYQPITLAAAVRYAAIMKLLLTRSGIRVIRTGLQSSDTLDDGHTILAGPYHPAFGEMVDAYLFYLMGAGVFSRMGSQGQTACIRHSPRDASRVRGNRSANRAAWQADFGLAAVTFVADARLKPGSLEIACGGREYLTNMQMLADF